MKKNTFIKRIMAIVLICIMVLGVMPATAYAASIYVPGAEGHELENMFTGTFTYGYNSTIFIYATPGAYEPSYTLYHLKESGGSFGVPPYDSEQWYFAGWKTWYKGSHSGAGIINCDEANPKYDDNDYYFTANTGNVYYPQGSMTVLKEMLWDGTYYLSAIYEPLVTVNAGEGVSYHVSGASKRSDSKYSTKYNSGMTINYTVDDKYIVTGVNATYGTNYSNSGATISVNTIVRPTTVSINSRLKQQYINFDSNGGSGTMSSQTFDYGVKQELSANSFAKSGYQFHGWNTEADGSGTAYSNEESVIFTPANDGHSITLYAQWTKLPEAQVSNNPTANTLTYSGSSQALITEGTASGGKMYYSLDGVNYSGDIPEATNAGDYTVYYYVQGDADHIDSVVNSIMVTIGKATPVLGVVSVDGIVKDTTTPDEVVLTQTGVVSGKLEITDPSMLANKHTYSYLFTPDDTLNYNTVNGTVQIDVLDTTAPEAEITVGTNSWNRFWNNVTFGLFFKNTQSVTITADDKGSGLDAVYYYLADKELSEDEVKAITEWKTYGNGFSINPENEYVIYAKAVDKDGNAVYLNSEGIVLDSIVPVISDVENGAAYYTTQKLVITDDNLDTVTVNGNKVTEDVVLAGNVDTNYTIVATDKAGNSTTVTVTMKTIASVETPISDITDKDVTSADKNEIWDVIDKVEELLKEDDIIDEERKALEDIRDNAQDLLGRIEDAKNAVENADTEKVKDITADNVQMDDKEELEKAKADLEKALEDYLDNYTEDEKKAIENDIKRIEEALDTIKDVEAVEDKTPQNGNIPNTGDSTNFMVWLILLFGSMAVFVGLVLGKKKKEEE